MSRRAAAVLLASLVLAGSPASGVEKCKVRVDKKTGDLLVSASAIVGTPQWGGGEPADAKNDFHELLSCVKAGKLKNCRIGAPGSVLARRAGASCQLAIRDDGGLCRTRIPGCTGIALLGATVTEVVSDGNWQLGRSFGAVSVQHPGLGEFEVEFDQAVDECIPSVTMTEQGVASVCAHCGATAHHIQVRTTNNAGTSADLRFYLTVACP
jgi:hypothetical protein